MGGEGEVGKRERGAMEGALDESAMEERRGREGASRAREGGASVRHEGKEEGASLGVGLGKECG